MVSKYSSLAHPTRCLLLLSGWFISDRYSPASSGATALQSVLQLTRGIPQSLMLENPAQEVALLVPTHDVHRVMVPGNPFGPALLFDRGSVGWQEAVSSPLYLYPVHPSKTLLMPRTLSGMLYLALLRMMQYGRCFSGQAFELVFC